MGGQGSGLNPLTVSLQRHSLTWFPESGVGYFEVPEAAQPYDGEYFERYRRQAATPLGRRLMRARVDLVARHWAGPVLDVGIGSGAFLEERGLGLIRAPGGDCDRGFDVNPAGVAWLRDLDVWGDLYGRRWEAATFWDALEHIRRPDLALDQVEAIAFVAIPTFRGVEHVLASKHFRRDEHFWYWTRDGFCRFAAACGFEVVDIVATETALGREDVETFVLRRIA